MEYLKVALTILGSVGVAGAIVVALASYLGRIWAARILEADRAKYAREVEDFKKSAALSLKEYEIKTSTIQAELNKIVLNLAPAFSPVQGACLTILQIVEMFLNLNINDSKTLGEVCATFQTKLSTLDDRLNDAELYLDSDVISMASTFRLTLIRIKNEACNEYAWDPDNFQRTGPSITCSLGDIERLRNEARSLDDLLEKLKAAFRRKMGTALSA